MKNTERLLRIVCDAFPMLLDTPLETRRLTVSGMNVVIRGWKAEGLGHVSCMNATGLLGVMKMDMLIINPTRLDMPLLTYERVNAMGNDTMIFGLYDTLLGETALNGTAAAKELYAALPDYDPGKRRCDSLKLPESLAKKGKKLHTAAFHAAAAEYVEGWLKDAGKAMPCEAGAKREKAAVYAEDLLKSGDPAVTALQKSLGPEKTDELLRTTVFGIR